MAESNLPMNEVGYDQAIAIALASRDHTFRFARPIALKAITETHGMMDGWLIKGCKLIEQGKSATWADMQGAVVEGPKFSACEGQVVGG